MGFCFLIKLRALLPRADFGAGSGAEERYPPRALLQGFYGPWRYKRLGQRDRKAEIPGLKCAQFSFSFSFLRLLSFGPIAGGVTTGSSLRSGETSPYVPPTPLSF